MRDRPDERLEQPAVARVLFHPRPEPAAAAPAGGRPVRITAGDGVTVGGWLFPAVPQAPLILFFHGNGEIALEYADLAPLFHQCGAGLLAMDYRGYGASGGTPGAASLVADAGAAFAAVGAIADRHGLAPRAIYVMGRSLGSAAALEIAGRSPAGLAGLILDSPFADTPALVARLGGPAWPSDADDRAGFGQLAKMARVAVPTLIIHGIEDTLIPAADAELLFHRCPVAEKDLVLVPRAGHNDLLMVGWDRYAEALRRFIA